MKRINQFDFLKKLYKFKTITDENGIEYVIFEDSSLDNIQGIKDKTDFEAIENHRHIIDNIKKHEFDKLCEIAPIIGKTLLYSLCYCFPNKKFIVYISLAVHDSLTVRFHQLWDNEPPYYCIESNDSLENKLFVFKSS